MLGSILLSVVLLGGPHHHKAVCVRAVRAPVRVAVNIASRTVAKSAKVCVSASRRATTVVKRAVPGKQVKARIVVR